MICESIEKDKVWKPFPLLHKLLGGCKFPDNYLGLPVVSSAQISYVFPGVALALLVKSESSTIIQAVRENPEIVLDLYREIRNLSDELRRVGEVYEMEGRSIECIFDEVKIIHYEQEERKLVERQRAEDRK
jgi:hypothetical protein